MPRDRRSAPIPRVVELYGLGRSTIYKLLNSGDIMGLKVGRRTLIDIESVEAFLAAQPRYPR